MTDIVSSSATDGVIRIRAQAHLRDHLREDGHELLDAERESSKIEQHGLRAGVDKQIEVTVVVGITPGDDPKTRILLTPYRRSISSISSRCARSSSNVTLRRGASTT
jgi:hypothetical protein